jgi:hypothetical protein
MNNCCVCWFLTHILLGILIFKGLTGRRLCKSFGVKGLINMEVWQEEESYVEMQSDKNYANRNTSNDNQNILKNIQYRKCFFLPPYMLCEIDTAIPRYTRSHFTRFRYSAI